MAVVIATRTEEIVNKGLQEFVEIDRENIRVTRKRKHLPADPKLPDDTWTTKIKNVVMNAHHQYVLTGAWNIESTSDGYQGPKIEPSQFVYSFWPVKKGLMWFKNGEPAYWIKLRQIGQSSGPRGGPVPASPLASCAASRPQSAPPRLAARPAEARGQSQADVPR